MSERITTNTKRPSDEENAGATVCFPPAFGVEQVAHFGGLEKKRFIIRRWDNTGDFFTASA